MGAQALNGTYQMAGLLNNRLSVESGATHYKGSQGVREAKELCPLAYKSSYHEKREPRQRAEITQTEIDAMLQRISDRRKEVAEMRAQEKAEAKAKAAISPNERMKNMGEDMLKNFFTERDKFNSEGWYSMIDCAKITGIHETTIRNWYAKGLYKQFRQSEHKKAVYLNLEEVRQIKLKHCRFTGEA